MSNLEQAVDELRAELLTLCMDQTGIDPATERPGDGPYHETRLPLSTLRRLRRELYRAARLISQQAERITNLNTGLTRARSSNGKLMVDRDRGIQDAGARAAAAWEVAERALTAAGITGGELSDLVADQRRYTHHVEALIDGERERLDVFRCSMLDVLRVLKGRDGLTANEVGVLCRRIGRANDKACGR